MIYASDIDRTLIFSERFLTDFNVDKRRVSLIDECKQNSYISKKVANRLSHLLSERKVRFIPVTTRSVEQFKRIQFEKFGIDIDYAITTNGGTILYKGEPVKSWEEKVRKQLPNKDQFNSVIDSINMIEGINYDTKTIDDRFIMSKCDSDTQSISLVKNRLCSLEKEYPLFRFLMYSNKVYAVPRCFGKDIALNWLKHKLRENKVLSSGDSAFDIPMLSISNFRVVPSHGSIADEDLNKLNVYRVTGGVDSALKTIDFLIDQNL